MTKKLKMMFAFAIAMFATIGLAADVSTVPELIDAVANAATGDEIVLAKGTYDLSTVPCMSRVGHLYSDKKISFRGATGDPDDVVVLGSTNRILYASSTEAFTIRDLTFKNGNCTGNTKTSVSPEDECDGGAICFRGMNTAAVVSNCVFVGNSAAGTGGAVGTYFSINRNSHAGHFFDCVFSNNTSAAYGGAIRCPIELVKCVFKNNMAGSSYGGAVYQARLVASCTFEGNSCNTLGGAITWSRIDNGTYNDFIVSNCTFRLNYAERWGGAIGLPDDDSTKAGFLVITNCTFEGNYCTGANVAYGGGAIYGITNGIVGCTFITNAAYYGSNIRKCADLNSTYMIVPDESAHVNRGQVAYESTLVGAQVTAAGSRRALFGFCSLSGCRVSGTFRSGMDIFYASTLNGCRVENVGKMNPSDAGPHFFCNQCYATNCLFANCDINCFFESVTGAWCNNTIVSNAVKTWNYTGKTQSRSIPVVNCLFYGNKLNGSWQDIDSTTATCVIGFTNSVFATSSANAQYAPGVDNIAILDGAAWSPRFVGAEDANDPYALKTSSPVRGKGLVLDWMADASDVRGDGFPRLRGGRVDIGCYQCWLRIPGLMMSFR